jgi:hypothetical protein
MRTTLWVLVSAALFTAACSRTPTELSAPAGSAVPGPHFATSSCSATNLSSRGAKGLSPWQPSPVDGAEFLASVPRAKVIRASDLGVKPNTGTDASLAIRAAIFEARLQRYDVLVIPAGVYLMEREIPLVSGLAVVGEGCGRTILRRKDSSIAAGMFRLDNVSGVRVQGIEFDANHAPEFYRFIGFRGKGSHDVAIVENCFGDSRPNTSGDDRFAIELTAESGGSSNLWIGRNRVSGWMQLTAGGGNGISVLRIVDNVITDAEQNAIAVTDNSDGAMFRDLVIARNRIVNAHAVGVYVGPDKLTARRGTYTNVLIADNVVTGLVNRYANAIYVRAASQRHEHVTVSGNVVEPRIAQKANGIRFEDTFGGGLNTFADVLVHNNEVRSFSRGIWLAAVDGGQVSANRLTGGSTLIVSPDSRDICVVP